MYKTSMKAYIYTLLLLWSKFRSIINYIYNNVPQDLHIFKRHIKFLYIIKSTHTKCDSIGARSICTEINKENE